MHWALSASDNYDGFCEVALLCAGLWLSHTRMGRNDSDPVAFHCKCNWLNVDTDELGAG